MSGKTTTWVPSILLFLLGSMRCELQGTIPIAAVFDDNQGCNSIDIWNLRLELGHKLRLGP